MTYDCSAKYSRCSLSWELLRSSTTSMLLSSIRSRNTNWMTYDPWKDQEEVKQKTPSQTWRLVTDKWAGMCLGSCVGHFRTMQFKVREEPLHEPRHLQHIWRPKVSHYHVCQAMRNANTLCCSRGTSRGGNQFPNFTVHWSLRLAQEDYLCSLQVLRKRGKTQNIPC